MKIAPNPARPGIKLRDPRTGKHIPATGKRFPDGDQWATRRLRDGDAVRVVEPAAEEG